MKRIVTTLCALAVIMVGSIPAMAAEEPPRQDASYYPISVDEYTYGELELSLIHISIRSWLPLA